MSDLIERLRGRADNGRDMHPVDAEIDYNAADEIERLTDELINVEQLAKDRYCKMQSEIERLRSDRPDWAEYQRLINENNQQKVEIERLTALRKEDREDMQRLSDQLDYLSDENAKLQADAEALQLARNKLDRCEGCGQIWAFGHQCDL